MKKAVALSALVSAVAVVFTATAAAIDIAGSYFSNVRLENQPTGHLRQERLIYHSTPDSTVVDTYTMILGTLALHAALNKMHRTPQPQVTPPR